MSTHNICLWRNKKNINTFGLKKKGSYQELCNIWTQYFSWRNAVFTLNIRTPLLLTSLVLRFEQVDFTLNVLKFQTLYSILIWHKFCFLCSPFLQFLVEWQTV